MVWISSLSSSGNARNDCRSRRGLSCIFESHYRGLLNSGFRKQILPNGHGPDYVIPLAMHQFAKKYQVPVILVNVNWWFIIPEYISRQSPWRTI